MYSILLYMPPRTDRKHRVTFRVAPEIAAALRQLPNQTLFVEAALRQALGHTCPVCEGRGRIAGRLEISDFKRARLPRLERTAALRLREVVRMGRRLCATGLELAAPAPGALAFRLRRKDELLLGGRIRLGREVTLDA